MATSLPAILALLFVTVRASTFLGAHPMVEMVAMPTEEVEQALFAELSAFTLDQDGRVRSLEQELRALFSAMPKNDYGNLDPTVVRYALHRYFAHKYGWHLRGLEPAGGVWNSTATSSIMKDRAPSYIQSLMEERMHGQGLGLHELAIFAATLMDLIGQEAVSELETVYAALKVPEYGDVSSHALDHILKMYLSAYIQGVHVVDKSHPLEYRKMEEDLAQTYMAWVDTKTWAQDLRRSLDFTHRAQRNPFVQDYTFDYAAKVAQEMGHRFGAFQNLECRALKEKLVEMEHGGSGRVTLAKFYSGIDDRDWPFIESVEYLRNLGALDETDPSRPSVVIPNFLGSPSNCIAPSSFYSVCCIDECEGLFAQVELMIGEPSATWARLAQVISGLESDTVEAPRNLSSAQLSRLDEIAAYHKGRIPLHGRLFAQWMHHAYPRECRFPHVAGTMNPLNMNDFAKQFGLDAEASDEEILEHTINATSMEMDVEAMMLPWVPSEELISPHRQGRGAPELEAGASSALRALLLLAAIASVALPMVRATKKLRPVGDKSERLLV